MNAWALSNEHRRLLAAIHEAGHAVANVRLDIEQERASIVADERSLGHVMVAADAWSPAVDSCVISLCCGYAAQLKSGFPELAECGCGDDFERATRLIERHGLPGNLFEWKECAVRLMSKSRNMLAVERVAEALLHRGTLPGDYVSLLVEVADGLCTEQEAELTMQKEDAKRIYTEREEEPPR